MTTKAFLVLLAGVLLAALSAALSVRALVYVSVLLGLVFFYALVSVWLARKTTRVYATVAETQVLRGDSNFLRLKAVRKSILPAGGVTICWRDGNRSNAGIRNGSFRCRSIRHAEGSGGIIRRKKPRRRWPEG